MGTLLWCVALTATGQLLIYAGLGFLAGKWMTAFHDALPLWARLMAFAVLASIPANLLIAQTFKVLPAGLAGAVLVSTSVVGMVISAMIMDGVRPNLNILMATLLLLVAAVWVALALKS